MTASPARRDHAPILVTGAAGFIGLPLVERLRACGYAVLAVDNGAAGTMPRLTRFRHDPLVQVHDLDLGDAAEVTELVADTRPEAVVHLAARHFIPACELDPAETLTVNVLGSQNLITACRARPLRKVVFASTAAVYRPSATPLVEDSPTGPDGVYGCSKLAVEWLLQEQLDARVGCNVVIARLFNVYGPGDPNAHLIPEVVSQAQDDLPLQLGDLTTARDFVHVDDTVDALLALLAEPVTGTYNVGTGVAATGRDVVDLVSHHLSRPLQVRVDPSRLRTSNRPHICADPSRLRALLPWWPRTTLTAGLAGLLAAEAQDAHGNVLGPTGR